MSLIKCKSRALVAMIFCIFIGYMFVVNISLIKSPVMKFIQRKIDFKLTTKEIATNYASKKLKYRYFFINVNGFFARMSGRRLYNNVLLLKSKMLTHAKIEKNSQIGKTIEKTIELANFTKELNIPFVYIAAPYKVSTLKDNIPEGIVNYANENTDVFLKGLTDAGIDTLDLRPLLSSTSDQVKKYFYSTDHHWNPDGAFVAFQTIIDKIETIQFENRKLNKNYTRINQWKRLEKKDWFLGAHGKRVGTKFAGTDSLIYYIPKFSTRMSLAVPHHNQIFKGDFVTANIRKTYIEKKDYFYYNAYCVYIGGDYPLVSHRNINAPNKMKVLVIKDSYVLPLQAFMSTVFSEIDVIDPRFYKASTIAEYITWTKPDIVLMVRYAGSTGSNDFHYNNFITKVIHSYREDEVLLKDYDVQMSASKATHRNNKLPISLRAGKTYSISFNNVIVAQGKTDGVSILLYDSKSKKAVNHKIFDVEFCKKNHEDAKWTFNVPEEDSDFSLLVYAGVLGKTTNVGVEYRGIKVSSLN